MTSVDCSRSYRSPCAWLLAVAILGLVYPASAAEQDLSSWSQIFINHDFDEHWSVSAQLEGRYKDDISNLDEIVVKPAAYYRFTDWLKLGVQEKVWVDGSKLAPDGRFDAE